MDESKHEIHSQVDAITAGTASVVNLTAGKLAAKLFGAEGGVGGDRAMGAVCAIMSVTGLWV